MNSFEGQPGDLYPEEDDKEYEEYSDVDEFVERVLDIIDRGGSVRLVLDNDVQIETIREFAEAMREAGVKVIFPSNN